MTSSADAVHEFAYEREINVMRAWKLSKNLRLFWERAKMLIDGMQNLNELSSIPRALLY